MTTTTEGAQLTQIGPGTVMGDLMRQYWIPAALSSELERDSAPIKLMLLGEKLIAFRDSTGHVGVMDHRCPHRCASLFLARHEEGVMSDRAGQAAGSSHVRNTPLATVSPKKAACRNGPPADAIRRLF